MANSRFEYVKAFEQEKYLLPETYIVIRIDGRGFHKFTQHYEFAKPNDLRALQLMNESAKGVMKWLPDVILAYGDSDEYSFVLRKECVLFERRESKLVSTFCSTFTALYQALWPKFYSDRTLDMGYLPTFDSRAVVYPSAKVLRDYLSWRQADCHINNLYNTAFWALVLKGGKTPKEAEQYLCGTVAADKNEILFKEFRINYNNEPEIYRKGTILVRDENNDNKGELRSGELTERQQQRENKKKAKAEILELHVDIIGDGFWDARPWLLK